MYLPIDKLINKCGRQFIVDLLPRLFININTASAEDKPSMIDYDYNSLKLSSPLLSLADTNTNTNTNNNNGFSQKYLQEHYTDINTIISLFCYCKGEIDISSFDYVVFSYLGMDYRDYIVQNPKYLRPEELPYLRGDSTKARTTLGWKPSYTFEKMIDEMLDYWIENYK